MRTYADGLPTLTMGLANFAPAPQPWDALLDRARLADETGIDRIIVVDHVVMGENIDAYDGGRFPTGPDGQWLEPMTTMAVIVGMTQHVRLSTGIILAALRRPGGVREVRRHPRRALRRAARPRRRRRLAGRGVRGRGPRLRRARPAAQRDPRALSAVLDREPRRLPVRRPRVRACVVRAEAPPAGRRADVGQRAPEPQRARPPRAVRRRLDPVGRVGR